MDDRSLRSPATDANGPFGLGLQLFEHVLEICETADSSASPAFGQCQRDGPVTRLRHWPDRIWYVSEHADSLPKGTDIGHGVVVLGLRGNGSLRFLADYCTADLQSAAARQAGTVRCGLGQFTVLMWWDITRDIHITIDRSQAQSLADFLRALVKRRELHDHLD
ncbi:hypothetical protein [Phaeobacter sp. C3_T13_0]|uniref:hypothetical protein n=1 Tax=Phaeobacter cretensis TaxID=3342641 RepID=UPI0039BCB47F